MKKETVHFRKVGDLLAACHPNALTRRETTTNRRRVTCENCLKTKTYQQRAR